MKAWADYLDLLSLWVDAMTMGFLPNPDDIRYFQELIRSATPQLQAAQATYKDFEKNIWRECSAGCLVVREPGTNPSASS